MVRAPRTKFGIYRKNSDVWNGEDELEGRCQTFKQMDITTAFLNGIILEELYMLQPEGLDDGSGKVCRLKKAIYGLKQAPRAWYHKLEETLLAGGFKKSECDHSLFLLQEKEQFLMLLVYVDDILLFSESAAMIERVEEMLEMQFKCSKMGDVKYYLGMHVERDLDKGVLRLHQRKYCEGLAEKYGLQDGGKPATPLPLGFTVEPCADEEVVGESDRKLFHSMVGALNYAANHTRPDIAFATSRLASVVSRPCHEQLEAAKRGRPDREPDGTAGHGRTVEECARTGPPEGSARETGTGRLSGVRVVRSRKKEREARESSVKVYKASAGASTAASALVAELVDFVAACRLDYATALVAASESASPQSVRGECALGTDVLEDRQEDFEYIPTPRSYAEAITGPYSSQWQAAMDAEMASRKSTGTYVDAVPPSRANLVDGMWIFRGVDYFQTFCPTPKMTTLRVLLHVAAQHDYELHSLDFTTTFLQVSLHEEIWLHRPPGFTRSYPAGTQWSLRRPVYGLRQAPLEWYNTLRTTLAALGLTPSTADPSLFLRTDTLLPPFSALVYVDDLVFATADTEALALVKSELQKRHTCTDLGPSALRLPALLATAQSSVYQSLALSSTFGRVPSWLATWLPVGTESSSFQAQIYAGAMAAQELRWLTYLLTELGEQPRSPRILYVDNKAMIALCQEHSLEHRTKHIALQYFLARELQQHGQLRLAYVATRANTADIFVRE
ncbi:unnamed protein product [Closterium sp. NIES-53]